MALVMNKIPAKIDNQAREWFVLMQSGAASATDQQRLDEWLSASPVHREAYSRCEQLWQDLGDLAHSPEAGALKRSVAWIPAESGWLSWLRGAAAAVSSKGRYLASPWSGVAYVAIVMWLSVVLFTTSAPEDVAWDHYRTPVAEIKKLLLEDGSEVVLGAKSEIRVRFDASERRVELLQGQAFFDVAASKEKPFFVEINNTLVTVIGTRFDVRRGDGLVAVAVEEGVVNVAALLRDGQMAGASGHPEPVVLVAGQKVSRTGQGNFQSIEEIALASVGAWRQGRLVYRGASLKEVVEDVNRYFAGTVSLASGHIADIEVTASFRADQVEDLPELLSGFLPVDVVYNDDQVLLLPKSGSN